MNDLLSLSVASWVRPLALAALVTVGGLLAMALRRPHLAKIGLRNVPRRWLRSWLIVAGLLLATMFIGAALAVGDTITLAVKNVAVFNLGRIDEQVIGGEGTLGLFPAEVGGVVQQVLGSDAHVAEVTPALVVPNLLVADDTARQVRGGISGLALAPSESGPLTDLRARTGSGDVLQQLTPGGLYLNRSADQLLGAQPGDKLYLYSTAWPGHRYAFRLRGIVSGGPLGDGPAAVLNLSQLQQLVGVPGAINRVYIANAGDGLTGVGFSDEITDRVAPALPFGLHTQQIKFEGVQFALQTQSVFGRILTLFTLFALAIGMLLIFLIFVLSAAERRAELGVARAIGMRRSHTVWLLLFEGSVYNVAAAGLGMLAGLGLGVAIVAIVGPTLSQLGFPLRVAFNAESILFALCLGFVFTVVTSALAAWAVTGLTIAAAMRDLPEPAVHRPGLAHLARGAWQALALPAAARPSQLLTAAGALLRGVVARGIVFLALGWWLLPAGIARGSAIAFGLGLSLVLVGAVMLLRWLALGVVTWRLRRGPRAEALRTTSRATRIADRLSALAIGVGLTLYWSLPFDALAGLGYGRFSGGIAVFFVAGVMMVWGAVYAIAANLDVLLAPFRWLLAHVRTWQHVLRVALVYPSQQRFRTGVSLALFALVCFTMVVMACISASTTSQYDALPAQAAGYDLAGQPLFSPAGGPTQVTAAIRKASPATANALAAVSRATPLPLAILQPGASNAGWRFYPASQVDGSFLSGVGLPLAARAPGFASDRAVWNAVATTPGDVVVDVGALSRQDADILGVRHPAQVTINQFTGPPIAAGLPGLNGAEALSAASSFPSAPQSTLTEAAAAAGNPQLLRDYTLRLTGVATGHGRMTAAALWVTDLRGGPAERLNVVGLVANERGQRYGLFGSARTFAPAEHGLPPFANSYYYFSVHPGTDVHAAALAIGSALIDHGVEVTVIQDVLLDVNGPRVFITRVLVGLVGLTLLVGMAALAVSGSRAVVERRQQIGMLRALGFHRAHVQAIFLLESLLVGVIGAALGMGLGLLLCRNVFAVDFFAQVQSGLVLVVPWAVLWTMCAAATAAAAVAALLPSAQAGAISAADALQYD